ncbi:MAG: flagellar motor switch protein FliN [Acidimicrobiia bacterium]|nr:flagellar motor switch protein FliN [Acidimicrobiia bacterium]
MTEQQATTETGGAAGQLGLEFEQRDLALAPSTEVPALDGPLSAVGFAPADGGADSDGRSAIAAAVSTENDLELFDLAVAAIQAANLDLAPATAVSIDSAAELTATVTEPHELFTVMRAGSPIGVVVRHCDRRGGGAAAAGTETTDTETMNQPVTAPPVDAVSPASAAVGGLGLLQDVVLEVTVELGRTRLPLSQLMNLGVGSVVELDRAAGAPVDVRVNGTLFARGEVVVVDDEYAVRILEILAPGAH